MENDLIRRDELKQYINGVLSNLWPWEWDTLGVLAAIDSIPAVDAVEVKHGYWIEKWSGNGWNEWVDCTCSTCKTEFERFEATKYCPECGARMDGEDGDGDG